MNCRSFNEFVEALPLRERGEHEMAAARRHCEHCSACAEVLDAALELERDLSSLPRVSTRAHFAGGVLARIRRLPIPSSASPLSARQRAADWQVMLAAAAFLAVVVLSRVQPPTFLQGADGLLASAQAAASGAADRVSSALGLDRLAAVWTFGTTFVEDTLAHAGAQIRSANAAIPHAGRLGEALKSWSWLTSGLATHLTVSGILLAAVLFWIYDDRLSAMRAPKPVDRRDAPARLP